MKLKKRLVGIVIDIKPAGGYVKTADGSGYYISNFDPLAGLLPIGTKVSFKPTNPGDRRNTAENVKVEDSNGTS